jgi:serine phosphatase RsbU (regulator of sigma subunit)
MFKSALRMRLLEGGPIASMLGDLNDVLFPLKSGAMYVTAVCVRGGPGGRLEYAVAGHLPILRVRAGSQAVEQITTPQIPIGMFERFEYQSAELECEPGDLLALITDGLTEVFDGREHEFGIEAVERVLSAAAHLPLREIGDRIIDAARAHGAQVDDQTLLLIRRRARDAGFAARSGA